MSWTYIHLLQQLNKRHLRRSKSLVSLLLWGDQTDDEFGKAKNVRTTELLVDLREAILQVARHFQSLDPKNTKVVSFWKTLIMVPLMEKWNKVKYKLDIKNKWCSLRHCSRQRGRN